jgi:hypothetical protein
VGAMIFDDNDAPRRLNAEPQENQWSSNDTAFFH